MKGYLALGLLLLNMACVRPTDAAAIQSISLVPEERLSDSSVAELVCSPPAVLFKTKGDLEICVDPKEIWMQKALSILKKRFEQS
uniref:C-C motif chemokine 8-like n=1 Tax=Pristiophorus japonicus TaxID=55135 RepID=UPI00398E41B5